MKKWFTIDSFFVAFIAAVGYGFGYSVHAVEKYITVNTDRKDDRFGETTALDADQYNALSKHDQSKYGKVTVIKGLNHFGDEALRLLCLEN